MARRKTESGRMIETDGDMYNNFLKWEKEALAQAKKELAEKAEKKKKESEQSE